VLVRLRFIPITPEELGGVWRAHGVFATRETVGRTMLIAGDERARAKDGALRVSDSVNPQ